MPHVICPEDNGNIIVIDAANPSDICLNIRGDNNHPDFFQWFNFILQGTAGEHCILHIDNANQVKYPDWNHYKPYQTYASYGNDEWFTVDTKYDEQTGELRMELTLEQNEVQFAFFPPYTYARHLDLIEKARSIPHCSVSCIGKTNGEDGRDITLLTFGTPSADKKEIWLIARQHPGEPQAEWYAEGLVEYLAENVELLAHYTFRIVPNMNPDGTYFGNLRTNKEGKDLNRMWQEPTIESSPEVYYALQAMAQTGVAFFMDIHSDEIIPEPFLDEAHLSCPEVNEELQVQERHFMDLYIAINPHMQNELNYGDKDRTDPVNMTLAAMAVGQQFNCPAFTLEMPTKSWSWPACKSLAADFFQVLKCFYLTPNMFSEPAAPMGGELQSPGKHSLLRAPKHTYPATEQTDTSLASSSYRST